ncbi:MAG: hypothetical protein AABZ53_09505 [Planctomycetota bacterium]
MHPNLAALALVASASMLGSAQAFVPWINTNGSSSTFDWFGGGSDLGLFGSPMLMGADTFLFFPNSFNAQSSDGHTTQTRDRMQVELLLHQSQRVAQISFINTWKYNVVGVGSSVSATSSIFLTDLNNFQTLSVTYTLPTGLTGLGELQAGPTINVPIGLDWSHFQLVVNTNFFATSGPGGFASLSMEGSYLLQIPAPGSLALLGIAWSAAPRRRR